MRTQGHSSFLLLAFLILGSSAIANADRTCNGSRVEAHALTPSECRTLMLDTCEDQGRADCGSSYRQTWIDNYVDVFHPGNGRTVPPRTICGGDCRWQCDNTYWDGDCFSASEQNCNQWCDGICVELGEDYPHCVDDHCWGCDSYPEDPPSGGDENGDCNGPGGDCSPVLISIGDGAYQLTSWEDGVYFDLNGDGLAELTAWTSQDSDDAFLALDRDGNGLIDDHRELFGNLTEQSPSSTPNGFLALALFDEDSWGGNEDGVISHSDAIYALLQLWFDWNHNGISEPDELSPLSELVSTIDLDYSPHRRVDGHGNEFRYRTKTYLTRGNVRHAYDVFFVHAP